MPVFRIYVEKKRAFAVEAEQLLADIRSVLAIESLEEMRLLNRYDVEGIDSALFEQCKNTVFSEPQLDLVYDTLPSAQIVFASEYLPGQFDQRADSCAQCIQIVSQSERPTVKTARVFLLSGALTNEQIAAIKKYVINPVESHEAALIEAQTLTMAYEIPTSVQTLVGFTKQGRNGLLQLSEDYALAMDIDDISFCQSYFIAEGRDPTITELRMIDTYWSDHCRHTTFLTNIENVRIDDPDVQSAYERYLSLRAQLGRTKPVCLMDIATIGAKYLAAKGELTDLDTSEEINACSVHIDVDVDGRSEPWLLLFKNETHNHPTEIEPFGGAATCIGGAIRDPLSGRGYVYQAMRVTGAGDPLTPVAETIAGKLPQRKLVTTAAAGFSSYGNQIGLATGLVDEIYHPGYVAKRMEIGAVIGATPVDHIRREVPSTGDVIVLLGGRTGRDGCGGATGSSKPHNAASIEECGAQVQKGNAPEQRKLQRLFRSGEVTRLIKRCNDFGAGGVAVAIGELADGLHINLDAVPKKYEGLDGTELAISESQERMAVVLDPADVQTFLDCAHKENLEATVVAHVTSQPRLTMDWNGARIVDISREFLDSNGAQKLIDVTVQGGAITQSRGEGTLGERFKALVSDLNVCSKKGLSERFDSTIGAGTVLMPFGGKHQSTPMQVMAAKIPVLYKQTKTCSVMSYGFNPYLSEKSAYHGAYIAVVESVAKLIAAGASRAKTHLTFQEYFARPGSDPLRWGQPFAALLGALDAQMALRVGAIGGKDSMSGSFEDIDVPPTLVSFAISIGNTDNIISGEFKKVGSKVVLLAPDYENGLPKARSLCANFDLVERLILEKKVLSAYTPTYGGIAEAIFKMGLGNGIGIEIDQCFDSEKLFEKCYGGLVLELSQELPIGQTLGVTTSQYAIHTAKESISMVDLQQLYENKLESVLPYRTTFSTKAVENVSYIATGYAAPKQKTAHPIALIPVFPGTNCEYDTAQALLRAGAQPSIMVVNNLSARDVAQSIAEMKELIDKAHMIVLPGGFSGGDEPDGSGKFITAFFRNPAIMDSVHELLYGRDGLVCGICNGFQALIKLGLVPFGKIIETDEHCPTLAFNAIGRHQSGLVRTRIASNKSPWLMHCDVGDVHTIAVSHGEGRFVCSDELLLKLIENGQIATQYVDLNGKASMDIRYNPNTSAHAVEGITSPDGRVFGKMGHSERAGENLYKNVEGDKYQRLFEGAVSYFSI